jgi:hypothetical protein
MLGHFALIGIWPLFLAAWISFVLGKSTAKTRSTASQKSILGLWLSYLVVFNLAAFFSFYYAMFAAVISAFFFFFGVWAEGLAISDLISKFRSIVSAKKWLASLAVSTIVAVAIFLHLFGYAVQGYHEVKHQGSAHRSWQEVVIFSTNLPDLFSEAVKKMDRIVHQRDYDPVFEAQGENFPYVGDALTVLCLVVLTAGFITPFKVKPNEKLWLVGTMITVFWSTPLGGIIVHAFVSSARCFNRLSPLVVLVLGVLMAFLILRWTQAFWSRSKLAEIGIGIIIGVVTVFEIHNSPQFRWIREMSYSTDPVCAKVGTMLKNYCQGSSKPWIEVSPPVEDILVGPYNLYHLAEKAGCRLTPINGMKYAPLPQESFDREVPKLRVSWDSKDYRSCKYAVDSIPAD